MATEYTTYPSDYLTSAGAPGFGYKIYNDGELQSDQAFQPGAPGFVGMLEAEARQAAEAEIFRNWGA